jgi:hypothetical protein
MEFGEPIPIGELERAARHHVLRSFHLYEDNGACDHDTLAIDQIAPLWGRAVFGHGQEQLVCWILPFGM